jgi:hypothetical protein
LNQSSRRKRREPEPGRVPTEPGRVPDITPCTTEVRGWTLESVSCESGSWNLAI